MFTRTEIDVTSASRPDPVWVKMDDKGHTHRWYLGDRPACDSRYDPAGNYHVPSLVRVDDDPWIDEDGEIIPIWHYACALCGETIVPGTCADTERQFVAGLLRVAPFTITIEPKTPDELRPYMDALYAGTTIPVAHPRAGYRFNAFITNITTHLPIGQDTPDRVDIVVQPTGPPI